MARVQQRSSLPLAPQTYSASEMQLIISLAEQRLRDLERRADDQVPYSTFDNTAAPTVDDDVDRGFYVGSRWLDTTNDKAYVCADNTDGAAVWLEFQPIDADLTAIAALDKTDGNIIVGNGTTWVAESGATARTSLGLGTGDSPQFTGVEVGHASDTTVTRHSAGNLSIEGNLVYRAGGTDVPVADGGTGASTAETARTSLGVPGLASANTFTAANTFLAVQSLAVSMGDDTATSILLTGDGVFGGGILTYFISAGPQGICRVRVGTVVAAEDIATIGATVAFTTGVLTGTTGTDARFTISAHTDGRIYFENRLGGGRTIRIAVFGS